MSIAGDTCDNRSDCRTDNNRRVARCRESNEDDENVDTEDEHVDYEPGLEFDDSELGGDKNDAGDNEGNSNEGVCCTCDCN